MHCLSLEASLRRRNEEVFGVKKSSWSHFYLFLENTAKTAKMPIRNNSIRYALSGDKQDKGDKVKFFSCNKLHLGKCTKPKNTAALNHQGGEKLGLVCNKSAHK